MRTLQRPVFARAVALLAPLPLAWLCWLVGDEASQAPSLLVLVLFVVGVSALGDRIAGILAALAGAVWFDFFFTSPYLSMAVGKGDDLALLVMFLAVGIAVQELALWGRRQAAEATRRGAYVEEALALSADPAEPGDPSITPRDVAQEIAGVLGVDEVTYAAGPPAAGDPVVGRDGVVTVVGRESQVERAGLDIHHVTAIPVRSGRAVVGHFRVVAATRRVRPTNLQLKAAVLLAEQVSRQPSGGGRGQS